VTALSLYSVIGTDPVQDILVALGLVISAIQLRNGQRLNDTKTAVVQTKELADKAATNAANAKQVAAVLADKVEDVHTRVNLQLTEQINRADTAEEVNTQLSQAVVDAKNDPRPADERSTEPFEPPPVA
jgi:hypothetical protein